MYQKARHKTVIICIITDIMVLFLMLFSVSQVMSMSSVLTDHIIHARIPNTPTEPSFHLPAVNLSRGKFLVARRNMKDQRFMHSVILLFKYNRYGAGGLIINKPSEVRLSDVLPEIKKLRNREDVLYIGGPVSMDKMMVLIQSDSPMKEAQHVFKDIYISSSKTLLKKIIEEGNREKRFRVYAGYAGWAPGQLEREVARGGWYIISGGADIIFHNEPSELWPDLIRRYSNQWVQRVY